jgi:predicted transposase YbfD/YdcC
MNYSTVPLPPTNMGEAHQEDLQLLTSLYEALQMVPDPRRGAGRRYPLAVVLGVLCLAKMAGQTSLKGASEWGRLRADWLASSFGLLRKQMPCQMTYQRLLERVDAQAFMAILAAFFTRWEASQRCANEPSRLQTPAGQREHAHIAIDGKAVRATSKQAHPVHQLSAYDVTTGTILFQINVREKENEISALKPLLTPAFVKERIFTLDALHTQTELCATIERFGGWYVLIAKDNQPTLLSDLVDFFSDPPWGWQRGQAETWDKAHGRLEHRQILCSPELNGWLAKRWAGVAQVFRLQRRTTLLKTGLVRQQTVYGISNLPMSTAPAERMLSLNRAHWHIENRLHWRRDVTLGEDRCQCRTGAAPTMLACLNSAIVSLMDRLGVQNVARQVRFFNAHQEQALQALLSGHCCVY